MKTIKDWQEHIRKLKENPEYKEGWIKNQIEIQKENFRNLKPFTNADDVPDLPRADKKEWQEFYVPILVKMGAIPKKDLVDGEWYYGNHRRCDFAKWDEKKNQFNYIRFKFGFFWDNCNHFEDDDGYALFVPLRLATQDEIKGEKDHLKK